MAGSEPSVRRPLNGWKEIAAYLGKSVRSVQRWEATLGLPVRRINTPHGHIVYAEADEIDQWRRSLDTVPTQAPVDPSDPESVPEPPPAAVDEHGPHPARQRTARVPSSLLDPRRLLVGLLLFVTVATWGLRQTGSEPVPVDFRLVDRSLEALSADGSVLWTHRFNRDVSAIPRRTERLDSSLIDMDGDGVPEVLAFVRFAQPGRSPTISDGMFCFDRNGNLKWRVIPDETLSFNEQEYSAPWVIQDFVVSENAGPRRVWVAFAHHTWWPSFVLEIDFDGSVAMKYVQSGRIFSVARWSTPPGGVLAVGGVTNERFESTLALLQDGDPPASFPGRVPGTFGCINCPDTRPRKVLLFSSSELSAAFPQRHAFVAGLAVWGSNLKVTLNEAIQPEGTHAVAMIGPDQTISEVSFADPYWRVHRQLAEAGQIDHDVEQCPERNRPRVLREWTLAEGWHEYTVARRSAASHSFEPRSASVRTVGHGGRR